MNSKKNTKICPELARKYIDESLPKFPTNLTPTPLPDIKPANIQSQLMLKGPFTYSPNKGKGPKGKEDLTKIRNMDGPKWGCTHGKRTANGLDYSGYSVFPTIPSLGGGMPPLIWQR